jgi:uncharacterized protein YdaU (DUF1376 family)
MNDLFFIDYEAKVMLADTVGMRGHCELAHRRLCDIIWATGEPPMDDPDILAEIARVTHQQWPSVRRELMTKGWVSQGGRFLHKGCLKTLERCRKIHEAKSRHGLCGAMGRWGRPSNARAIPALSARAMPPQWQSQSQSPFDQTRARARGRLIDEKNLKGKKMNNPTFTALKLANRIISDDPPWFYDNCKVELARLKPRSLQTIIEPFIGQLAESKILACWSTAVRLAHSAKVDKLARNATPYAVECFKQQLQQKGQK